MDAVSEGYTSVARRRARAQYSGYVAGAGVTCDVDGNLEHVWAPTLQADLVVV